jgi:hypothetical protein
VVTVAGVVGLEEGAGRERAVKPVAGVGMATVESGAVGASG